MEIPADSCHFFCRLGNPCATPIVTCGEGSFSYQGVNTRGVRHAPVFEGAGFGGPSRHFRDFSGIFGPEVPRDPFLVDVSDIFYFLSARGGRRGSPRRREGGHRVFFFLVKIPGGRGGPFQTRGAEGPGGFLRRIGEFGGGGGAKYFFSGPKCPPSLVIRGRLVPNASWMFFWGGTPTWSCKNTLL